MAYVSFIASQPKYLFLIIAILPLLKGQMTLTFAKSYIVYHWIFRETNKCKGFSSITMPSHEELDYCLIKSIGYPLFMFYSLPRITYTLQKVIPYVIVSLEKLIGVRAFLPSPHLVTKYWTIS